MPEQGVSLSKNDSEMQLHPLRNFAQLFNLLAKRWNFAKLY